ncbi:hypothetical protein Tco_1019087 [Tanacetum coccineum]|uniref:Homeodomain-like protein n=1 Tax=Tanacetum coccineum TaxID=301880 RepID=A0ABQ5FW71_9ASTR
MSKVLQERGFGSLPNSTEANPRDQVKSISMTIKADSCLIRHIGSSQYAVSTVQNRTLMYETRQTMISFPSCLNGYYCEEKKGSHGPQFSEAYSEASHINNSIPIKEKDPGSFTLPCFINNVCFGNALFDLEASIDSEIFQQGIAENNLVEPLLSTSRAKIDVLQRKITLKIRRNKDDGLMPTIEEGEVIEEFRTRDDELDTEIDDYPSYCDYDKKIYINCAYNLKFSCMIEFEFMHADFFLLIYVNVMSKEFHNSIMKDKMVYKGNNVIGALMNVPIFVGTFSVVTDFAVLENMDAYRDEGIGDVIFGEPFLREVGIKTRRFEGMITIYNGNDEVTYQVVRSHPRFKHHTNEQCNKIPPLLKVSNEDKKNGISHPYQKLKGFYKGVLNLRSDYI